MVGEFDMQLNREAFPRGAAHSPIRAQFEWAGIVFTPQKLSAADVALVTKYTDRLCLHDGPERIVEPDGRAFSTYVAATDPVIHALACLPALAGLARELLNDEVYLFQCKVNHKVPLHGSELSWHRDYPYWRKLDGIPAPQILTTAILLDAVGELNSPTLFACGTHRVALDETDSDARNSSSTRDNDTSSSWSEARQLGRSTVVSPLRFQAPEMRLLEVLRSHEIVAFKGDPGGLAVFHGNTLHASSKNVSPWERRMIFMTFNAISNAPATRSPRPAYIANPDPAPLRVASDDTLHVSID
jgi:ectoine hydroxylase